MLVAAMGLVGALSFAVPTPVLANEEDLLFVERLRGRGYHDTALLFLDQLQSRRGLDAPTKQRIPYERAITLLDAAKSNRDSKSKSTQLDSALAYLNQFVKESPDRPEAATANLRRAEILLARTSAEVGNAKSLQGAAANEANEKARKSASEARAILTTAEKQYEEALKAFAAHIDKAADPEKFAARAETENQLISVQLDLARSNYEEAQALPQESAERRQLLQSAAEAYEKLHQKYRTNVAGLVARMWQGKCFEEQGDLPKALGVYKEILDQPDNSPSMSSLKDQARQFQLICLNRKSPPDYTAVTQEGEEWVKAHRALLRSRVGLGIRLELAKAYEGLGDDRNLIKPEQLKYWRLGATHARDVAQFGEFSREGTEILRRLDKKISGDEKAPDTFEPAFFAAQAKVQEMQDKRKLYEEAVAAKKPAAELAKMQQELTLIEQEAMRSFELAMKLVTKQDDPKKVNTARYLYGLSAYLTRRSYEAAVITEQAALMARGDDELQLAMDASYLSLMSLMQGYTDGKSEGSVRDSEIDAIINSARRMVKRFPDTEKANEARMQLGRMYSQLRKPQEAAEWFTQIPDTSGKYPDAQMAAGQAYWTAYLGAAGLPESQRPDTAELSRWKQIAQEKLKLGIAKINESVPPEGASPAELIAAKWSLAQILVSQGQDKEAVALLTGEPHAPRKAIAVPDEKKRPAKGIQSRAFASETLKLLVRAYIGSGQTKEANQAMKDLEKVASGQAGGDVTQLYIGISKLLKEELDRFKGTGETERYNQLRTAFEEFMNDLSMRTEGQTWASLTWIGETYAALGEASAGDTEKQEQFFGKSVAAYESILSKSESEPGFADANQLLSTKIRLIRAYRMKKDFESGEKIIDELIAKRKNDVLLQTQAAELYLDWGMQNDSKYLDNALVGNTKNGVWGFGALGQRLQQAMDSGRDDLLPQYLDARYNAGIARVSLAEAQTDPKKRALQLRNAETELVGSLSILPDLDDDQRTRFNDLYRKILEAAGKEVVDLPRQGVAPVGLASTERTGKETPGEAEATGTAKAKTDKPGNDKTREITQAEPQPSNMGTYAAVAFVLLVCCAIVGYLIYSGLAKKKPKRVSAKVEAAAVNMDFSAAAAVDPVFSGPVFSGQMPPGPLVTGTAAPAGDVFDFNPAIFDAPSKPATKPRPASATKPPGATSPAKPPVKPPAPAGTARPAPRPTGERPTGERPAGERPVAEKPAGEGQPRPAAPRPPRPKPPTDPAG